MALSSGFFVILNLLFSYNFFNNLHKKSFIFIFQYDNTAKYMYMQFHTFIFTKKNSNRLSYTAGEIGYTCRLSYIADENGYTYRLSYTCIAQSITIFISYMYVHVAQSIIQLFIKIMYQVHVLHNIIFEVKLFNKLQNFYMQNQKSLNFNAKYIFLFLKMCAFLYLAHT